jgi:periplasmic mercuric ion binding protein
VSKLLASAAIAVGVVASSTALAVEKTITLAVKNMHWADCPFIVRKSLEAVPGVSKAIVSYKDKTAVVTYDDTEADIAALTRATTEAGYPPAPPAEELICLRLAQFVQNLSSEVPAAAPEGPSLGL